MFFSIEPAQFQFRRTFAIAIAERFENFILEALDSLIFVIPLSEELQKSSLDQKIQLGELWLVWSFVSSSEPLLKSQFSWKASLSLESFSFHFRAALENAFLERAATVPINPFQVIPGLSLNSIPLRLPSWSP